MILDPLIRENIKGSVPPQVLVAGQADGPPTPKQMLERFIGRLRTKNSKRAYLNVLSSFFPSSVPDDPVIFETLFTTDRIIDWYDRLKQEKAHATVQQHYSILAQFARDCHAAGLLPRHPMTSYDVPPPAPTIWEPSLGVEVEEIQAMLRACDRSGGVIGARDKAIIRMGVACCLRVSEIPAINYQDFVLVRKKTFLKIENNKTGRPQDVEVNSVAKKQVEDYILEYGGPNRLPLENGRGGKLVMPVFLSLSRKNCGKRLGKDYVAQMIKRRAKEAGVSVSVTSHSLRHSGITFLIEAGVPLNEVRDHARHASVDQTLKYRDLLLKSTRKSAADVLQDVLG